MNFILITCFIVVSYHIGTNHALDIPDQLRVQAKKLHKLCQKDTGVAEELIQQSHSKLSNDRALQCYFHCMLDKVGLIDSNNIVHLEHLKEILPPELHSFVQNLVDACGTQAGADGCETAYLTTKCYLDSDPEIITTKFGFIFE